MSGETDMCTVAAFDGFYIVHMAHVKWVIASTEVPFI